MNLNEKMSIKSEKLDEVRNSERKERARGIERCESCDFLAEGHLGR